MSTLDPKLSKVTYFDRTKDFTVLAKDEVHVRIYKLFPMCRKRIVKTTDYRVFHLRYYIPREIFDDKTKKVKKLFIMFNGLDEVDHFTLYDQIGQGLAKYGYASVLLPLPNHLNRNPKYRFKDPRKIERPSQMFLKERNKIFSIYLQLLDELRTLIKHINGKCRSRKRSSACGFYNHFFSSDTIISLLGYSLGGLAALCAFLVNRNQINSCIMLNSGAKLDDIDVSAFMRLDKWKDMVLGIQKDWDIPQDMSMEARLFEKVFLGKNTSLLKIELKEDSRRICFIIGGSDSVTKYKSIIDIEPEEHGLATLKLPGINHFLTLDMQWNKWFKLVVATIAQFDDSASCEILTPSQIVTDLMYYQSKYRLFQSPGIYTSESISEKVEEQNFQRTLYAAEAHYGSVAVAVVEMFIAIQRMINSPTLYPEIKSFPYRTLLGQRAVMRFGIDQQSILDMLKIQRDTAEKKNVIPKMAELLLNNKKINKDQMNMLLNESWKPGDTIQVFS